MRYQLIELTDRYSNDHKDGSLCYAGKPSEDLITELELDVVNLQGGYTLYKTTLAALGEKGWELQFVTPCGVNFARRDSMAGPIENSYIFRKSE